jgi:hypothetical protein
MAKAEAPEPEEEVDDDALPPEQEERIVTKVVDRVKSVLSDIVGAPSKDAEPVEEELAAPAKEPTTVKEIETDMEAQVREALKKIGAEEEHQKQHETLKKEAERPPVQVGRVTRALWGGGES